MSKNTPALFACAAASFVLLAICPLSSSLKAAPITAEEQQLCRDDYHRFCQGLTLGSDELRTCMNKAGRHLSHDCVGALIDAGEVSRTEVDRRKHEH